MSGVILNSLLVIFYFVFPLIVITACRRVVFLNKIGSVVITFFFGVILGIMGFFRAKNHLVEGVASVAILLGLPMLMYSLDIRRWWRNAGKSLFALFLGLIAIIVVTILGFYLFKNHLKEPAKISGMLISLYTGGTPNLAAMKTALNVDNQTFIIINTYDMIVGFAYFMFVITIAQAFFNLFLKPFKPYIDVLKGGQQQEDNGMEYSVDLWSKKYNKPVATALGLSILITTLSLLVGRFLPNTIQMTAIILLITTLAILASLNKKIRRLKKTFSAGMYLILVFCFAMGSMADLKSFTFESVYILYYIILIIFGTLILHAIFAWIFRIDTDTFIMVSVGLIFSPPYVPAVAASLRNKEVILAGIISGLLSYAVGNYMGVAIAYLLR